MKLRRSLVIRSLTFGTVASLISLTPACAQAPGTKSGGAVWDGSYWGEINGQILTGRFETVEGGVQGLLQDPSGYAYQVLLQTSRSFGAGVFVDPQAGTQMMVESELRGDSLGLLIQAMQSDGSPGAPIQMLLLRGTPPVAQSNRGPTAPGMGPQTQPAAGGTAGDPRLVGTWQYTDSYVSGDFSMATSYTFGLSADGSFVYGSGGLAGGGNAGSMSSGGGVTNRGQWRVDNGVLLLNEGAGWQPYARYIVDQQQMMLTFGDNTRQLWQRVGY